MTVRSRRRAIFTRDNPIRDEAGLALLQGGGMVLETARLVSNLLRSQGIEAAVIGGVAVYLHGYVRTTTDVDLLAIAPPEQIRAALEAGGLSLDQARREFHHETIPVHLVLPDQAGVLRHELTEVNGIQTISLGDLISMKLRSGLTQILRAKDLGDVIGLIRARGLTNQFAGSLDPTVRKDFRKFVKAIRDEKEDRT